MADPNNSSISNSEPVLPVRRVATAWTLALLGLIAADLLIGRLVVMPLSPSLAPTSFQRYFDYGRSVEAKLRRMVGKGEADTAVVAYAGWLDEQVIKPNERLPEKMRVAVYGQSFAFQIAEALQRKDDRFQVVARLGGPSAPLSHSYAAYRADNSKNSADLVIVGVLASSLPRLVSLTNTTTWFESPTPFTYPRYRLHKDILVSSEPLVATLSDLRLALSDPVVWQAFASQLRRDDAAYNALVFESDIFDYSTLGRLLRRGYGQRHLQAVERRYHQRSGFTNRDGLLDITKALVADIARIAAERGQTLCVLLIHDKGFDDHLASALSSFLDSKGITFFSSHLLAPPSDSSNFLIDGHFTEEINNKLATGLVEVLRKHGIARVEGAQ